MTFNYQNNDIIYISEKNKNNNVPHLIGNMCYDIDCEGECSMSIIYLDKRYDNINDYEGQSIIFEMLKNGSETFREILDTYEENEIEIDENNIADIFEWSDDHVFMIEPLNKKMIH